MNKRSYVAKSFLPEEAGGYASPAAGGRPVNGGITDAQVADYPDFDPLDSGYPADSYPYYAWFREDVPVYYAPKIDFSAPHQGRGGGSLSQERVVSIDYSLSFAGHETTTNLVLNGLRNFLSTPNLWQELQPADGVARAQTMEGADA